MKYYVYHINNDNLKEKTTVDKWPFVGAQVLHISVQFPMRQDNLSAKVWFQLFFLQIEEIHI